MKKKPKRGKTKPTYYCSRCGSPAKTFRHKIAFSHIRERCSACGGNLVKKCELPPEVKPIQEK